MLSRLLGLLLTLQHGVHRAACIVQTASKAIIVDTDIYSDVDDVGALAVANVMHNCGYAKLVGVATSTQSKYGVMAIDVSLDTESYIKPSCGTN
jgi:hypothetical protein